MNKPHGSYQMMMSVMLHTHTFLGKSWRSVSLNPNILLSTWSQNILSLPPNLQLQKLCIYIYHQFIFPLEMGCLILPSLWTLAHSNSTHCRHALSEVWQSRLLCTVKRRNFGQWQHHGNLDDQTEPLEKITKGAM